jgi:glycosyltransferase involved in cell wall biosynthesis
VAGRVLAVSPSGVFGGAERILADLAADMPALGWEYDVLLLQDGDLGLELERRGVRTTVLDAGRLRDPRAFLRSARAIRRRLVDYDVIISNLGKAHLYVAAAAWGKRHPPLLWWQGGIPAPPGHMDRAVSRLPAAAVLTMSGAAQAAQSQMAGTPPTHLVYPGTDTSVFSPTGTPVDLVGRRPGDVVIGLAGRIQPWKGQDLFLEAAARAVQTSAASLRFVVVGGVEERDRAYANSLHVRAEEPDLRGRVTFVGHRTDMPAVLRGLDVVVNASRPEPFGLAVTEAMACGRTVLAYNQGGPGEIVQHAISGWLLDLDGPDALASAIVHLASDERLRAALGRAGRTRVLKDFSTQATAQRLAVVLEALTTPAREG